MTDIPIKHTIKGYWIARLDITDEGAYAEYRKRNAIAFAAFGGRFLVRGGPHHVVAGTTREHNVVIEFDSHERALACYRSPEYTKAKALRAGAVDIDIIVIEGYDGPQPTD